MRCHEAYKNSKEPILIISMDDIRRAEFKKSADGKRYELFSVKAKGFLDFVINRLELR